MTICKILLSAALIAVLVSTVIGDKTSYNALKLLGISSKLINCVGAGLYGPKCRNIHIPDYYDLKPESSDEDSNIPKYSIIAANNLDYDSSETGNLNYNGKEPNSNFGPSSPNYNDVVFSDPKHKGVVQTGQSYSSSYSNGPSNHNSHSANSHKQPGRFGSKLAGNPGTIKIISYGIHGFGGIGLNRPRIIGVRPQEIKSYTNLVQSHSADSRPVITTKVYRGIISPGVVPPLVSGISSPGINSPGISSPGNNNPSIASLYNSKVVGGPGFRVIPSSNAKISNFGEPVYNRYIVPTYEYVTDEDGAVQSAEQFDIPAFSGLEDLNGYEM